MSESKTRTNSSTPLIVLSILMMLTGVVLFYYFSEIRLFYRVLGMLTVIVVSAAIIYHYGLFGAQIYHLSMMRVSGILVMVFGVWLTQNA